MNWYKVFYWITVADGVKKFFDIASDVFMTFAIISVAAWIITSMGYTICVSNNNNTTDKEEQEDSDTRGWIKARRIAIRGLWPCCILAIFMWAGYVFCPTKKDALIIVAGGAVGNFITSDSSIKQLPHEAIDLLRTKIRSEIEDIKNPINYLSGDTLKDKTKEQLIEILKEKSKSP